MKYTSDSYESIILIASKYHEFRPRHFVHGVRDATEALAGGVASAERHPIDTKCGVVVHHHSRGIELGHGIKGDVDVFGENGGLEVVVELIGPANGFVTVVVWIDAHNRTEDLLGGHVSVIRWVP